MYIQKGIHVKREVSPPPLKPSGRKLVSSAIGPWFNPQAKTRSYQRRYKMVPIVPWFSIEKGNTDSFLRIKKWIKSGMEILQSRRSLAVVAGIKKTNDHAELTKVVSKKEGKLLGLLAYSIY